MNRIFRSGRGNARTLSDRTVSGTLLPATAVLIGAYQVTQASSASGGRWGILGDRDFYTPPGSTSGGPGPFTGPLRRATPMAKPAWSTCRTPARNTRWPWAPAPTCTATN